MPPAPGAARTPRCGAGAPRARRADLAAEKLGRAERWRQGAMRARKGERDVRCARCFKRARRSCGLALPSEARCDVAGRHACLFGWHWVIQDARGPMHRGCCSERKRGAPSCRQGKYWGRPGSRGALAHLCPRWAEAGSSAWLARVVCLAAPALGEREKQSHDGVQAVRRATCLFAPAALQHSALHAVVRLLRYGWHAFVVGRLQAAPEPPEAQAAGISAAWMWATVAIIVGVATRGDSCRRPCPCHACARPARAWPRLAPKQKRGGFAAWLAARFAACCCACSATDGS